MLCSLCTLDVLRGTMYRTHAAKHFQQGFIVCDTCHSLVSYAERTTINEPLCACQAHSAHVCESGCIKRSLCVIAHPSNGSGR